MISPIAIVNTLAVEHKRNRLPMMPECAYTVSEQHFTIYNAHTHHCSLHLLCVQSKVHQCFMATCVSVTLKSKVKLFSQQCHRWTL